MHEAMGKWMAGVITAVTLCGCGNEKCAQLGEHMADLAIAEAKSAGDPVADDKRADIVKKTTDSCNADPPEDEKLDCALKAETTKAVKLCDGVDEDKQKCAKLGTRLADLALKEGQAAGKEIPVEERDRLAKVTKEACEANMPPAQYLNCALHAESTKAVQKCDVFKEDAEG